MTFRAVAGARLLLAVEDSRCSLKPQGDGVAGRSHGSLRLPSRRRICPMADLAPETVSARRRIAAGQIAFGVLSLLFLAVDMGLGRDWQTWGTLTRVLIGLGLLMDGISGRLDSVPPPTRLVMSRVAVTLLVAGAFSFLVGLGIWISSFAPQ